MCWCAWFTRQFLIHSFLGRVSIVIEVTVSCDRQPLLRHFDAMPISLQFMRTEDVDIQWDVVCNLIFFSRHVRQFTHIWFFFYCPNVKFVYDNSAPWVHENLKKKNGRCLFYSDLSMCRKSIVYVWEWGRSSFRNPTFSSATDFFVTSATMILRRRRRQYRTYWRAATFLLYVYHLCSISYSTT